jgi:hypothetical protein
MSRLLLSVLFALDVTLLVLLVVAAQFTRPGTAESAILQVTLGILLLTLVGIVVAVRRGMTLFEG